MMIEFWIAALGLLAAVAVALLRALRPAQGLAAPEMSADLLVYRDQLAEVDRDLAKGILNPDEGERLRTEVARRLLEANRAAGKAAVASPPAGWASPAGLIVVLLAVSLGGYLWLGAPGYPDLPIRERLDLAAQNHANRPDQDAAEAAAAITGIVPKDIQEAELLDQLRKAVANRPDDLQGHRLLVQSETAVGNWPAARRAQARVIALLGAQAGPQDHAQLAELMILAAGGLVTAEAEAELVRVLTADPRNGAARYYSGVMLAQVGRPDQAFALWRPLLEESGPGDRWYDPIRGEIENLAAAAGVAYALPQAAGPGAAEVAAAAEMSAEEREAMITGMVEGLEQRLLAEGGPAQDWARLIQALGVLGAAERLQSALKAAETDLTGDAAGLAMLHEAARAAGVAP